MRTKIAFLILAHTDPLHLYRLCRALGPDDDIFVHIDKRSDFSSFKRPLIPSNVSFVQRRIPVFWGHISVVEATLILLEEAMQSKTDYLRLVLLSGACYPLKKVAQLRDYFLRRTGHLDIAYTNILEYSDELIWKVSSYQFRKPWIVQSQGHPRANNHVKFFDKTARKLAAILLKPLDRGFRRKFPELIPYVGCQFWSITPECARMVLQFLRDHPEFLHWHKYSWAPDEHFFHTIIGNSEFSEYADGVVPYGHGTNTNNLHTHRYPILTVDHLDAILASGRFFVRKAETGKSDLLLDYLDERVLSR